MIAISITNIFVLYIGLIFLVGLLISLYCRRTSEVIIKDKDLFICPVCAYRYIINSVDRIHRCPQCESLNTQINADYTQMVADKR